ncbi:uncharacterized protein [Amphiura filiformis]|uniref:uncharacterized protein n=1 Tax=Amphiura filiformis TaxID=82378 RepID=UPI003B2273F9
MLTLTVTVIAVLLVRAFSQCHSQQQNTVDYHHDHYVFNETYQHDQYYDYHHDFGLYMGDSSKYGILTCTVPPAPAIFSMKLLDCIQCSIQHLRKRSNQGLNLSNTNRRRADHKKNATMLLLIILLGGDVQLNPGPTKFPCGICDRPVAKSHRGLECDECGFWVHIRCGDVTAKQYEKFLKQDHFTWICPHCALPNFSDSFFDESNLADKNPYDSISELDSSSECFPNSSNSIPLSTSSPKSKDHQNKDGSESCSYARPTGTKQQPKSKSKSKVKKKELKIMTINCQGLKGKKRQSFLATIIDTEKPDIILGQESKLDSSYTDSEVFPEGYLVKRKDRNANGGGVFIAYRDNMVVNEVKGIGKDSELVVLKIEVWKCNPIYIASFYRTPIRDHAPLVALQSDLEKLFHHGKIPKLILCGDFNLPSIHWQNHSISENPQYGRLVNESMLDLVDSLHLEQKVHKPTRKGNILDLIFTNVPDSVQGVNVVPGMSDHEAVTANCETNVQTNKKKPRTVHIYKKANLKGIEEDLQDFSDNFHSSTEKKTCSDNWECFKEALQDAMNKYIPTKRLSGRWNLPWMNNNIKHLMKKRRRRYDAWKKFGDRNDLADYKNLKQEVETALKHAHDEYIEGVFEEDTGNPAKKLWSYVKSLKIDKIGIPPLLYKNRLVSQPKQKAEALSEQYRSVFTSESTSHLPSKGPSKHATMPDIEITTNGIEKLLTALNPKKAVGPDQVSTWMLKTFASTLAPILKEIFNQSLRTGDVPADWKLANISAIFKKGERNDPANYRPVSLTSVTCKLMEHVLASSIRGYLDDNNILSTSQHGFRKKHSCETQLLGTVEDLTRSLDNREQMDCLILDFSKAFDAVPHQRLLYKLNWYGIRGQTHTWIRNWLTSRKQTVVIEERNQRKLMSSQVCHRAQFLAPCCLFYLLTTSEKKHLLPSDYSLMTPSYIGTFHPKPIQMLFRMI